LQDLDNSAASIQIIQNVSAGVAYANYTAHCGPSGWSTPSFETSDISGLNNQSQYGLLVGNCCLSNKFDETECFGEGLLRAVDKGAIGYIGGSNSTYWDEDYWWGCGKGTPVENPEYNNFETGAYDGMFHNLSNEVNDISKWFITQSQMNLCGQLAVNSTTSSRKEYYWEIYHLMGDPTLIPYIGVPDVLDYTFSPDILLIGSSSLEISTVPYAYIAMHQDGNRIAVASADLNGNATLNFESALTGGEITLVITAQNRIPVIETLTPNAADAPYVLLSSYTPESADFNSSLSLSATLENVAALGSGYDAAGVTATLSITDPFVTITDASADFGTILAGETSTVVDAFSIEIADNVPDQYEFNFTLDMVGSDAKYDWTSNLNITANAPEFAIGTMTISDDTNGDGGIDPGETATLSIATQNVGHADATQVVSNLFGNSPYFTIIEESVEFDVTSQGEELVSFNVEANESCPEGTIVNLSNDVVKGDYTANASFDLVIGQLPVITIGTGTTASTNYPFYTYYENNKSQILYLGSEIGTGTVNIQELAFDFTSSDPIITDLTDLTIKFNQVGITSLGTAYNANTGAITVLSSASFEMPQINGWYSFDIDDYSFDATQNLLVEITWGDNGAYGGSNAYYKVNCSATALPSVAYGYADSETPPVYDGNSTNRPNIQFFVEGAPVGEIREITFSVVDGTKALVTDAEVKIGSLNQSVDEFAQTIFNIIEGEYVYIATAPGFSSVSNSFVADLNQTIEINMGQPNSITELKDIFNIYPNPSNGLVNIEISKYDNSTVTVMDLSGRVIMTKELNQSNSVIDLKNQAKGIYLIKLNIDNQTYNSKIILY
jgi:hypothetical protein